MTWMSTWRYFLEVRLKTSLQGWVEQKARPNPQHRDKSCDLFFGHFSPERSQDTIVMNINHILLVSWGPKAETC